MAEAAGPVGPAFRTAMDFRTSMEGNSMRTITKALVGATTAVGIAVGGLATAGTAAAAPAPQQAPAQVASADVTPLAVVNLGLTNQQARWWQCYLRDGGYRPGTIDGYLGTDSWKA